MESTKAKRPRCKTAVLVYSSFRNDYPAFKTNKKHQEHQHFFASQRVNKFLNNIKELATN